MNLLTSHLVNNNPLSFKYTLQDLKISVILGKDIKIYYSNIKRRL